MAAPVVVSVPAVPVTASLRLIVPDMQGVIDNPGRPAQGLELRQMLFCVALGPQGSQLRLGSRLTMRVADCCNPANIPIRRQTVLLLRTAALYPVMA